MRSVTSRRSQAAAPDRVSIGRYAQSWEGRDLVYVVVTSAREHGAHRRRSSPACSRLADPRQTTSRRSRGDHRRPARRHVAVLCGVHGNEISSTDASMLTAYHLLASRGDERVADIMNDTVVVIDPDAESGWSRSLRASFRNRPRASCPIRTGCRPNTTSSGRADVPTTTSSISTGTGSS